MSMFTTVMYSVCTSQTEIKPCIVIIKVDIGILIQIVNNFDVNIMCTYIVHINR